MPFSETGAAEPLDAALALAALDAAALSTGLAAAAALEGAAGLDDAGVAAELEHAATRLTADTPMTAVATSLLTGFMTSFVMG
jgi:hypothetical protein